MMLSVFSVFTGGEPCPPDLRPVHPVRDGPLPALHHPVLPGLRVQGGPGLSQQGREQNRKYCHLGNLKSSLNSALFPWKRDNFSTPASLSATLRTEPVPTSAGWEGRPGRTSTSWLSSTAWWTTTVCPSTRPQGSVSQRTVKHWTPRESTI